VRLVPPDRNLVEQTTLIPVFGRGFLFLTYYLFKIKEIIMNPRKRRWMKAKAREAKRLAQEAAAPVVEPTVVTPVVAAPVTPVAKTRTVKPAAPSPVKKVKKTIKAPVAKPPTKKTKKKSS
jgi:hypothetical protein